MESTTTHALKEWDVAIDALEAGKTILLLRKGGIREEGGSFKVAHREVLLYPTYEHQQPNLLKPDYAAQVCPVQSGWHPETVQISSWAEITEILPVSEDSAVKALSPYHIWNEQFITERLKWKPRQPIYLLLLRTFRLPQNQLIVYRPEYGGCKSWIDLAEPISTDGAVPVLDDQQYDQLVAAIRRVVESVSVH